MYSILQERHVFSALPRFYFTLTAALHYHPKIRPYLMARLAQGGDTIICDSQGRQIPADVYREHFAALMEQIGAPEATPHWCRHTFATRLHTAQADPLAVKWLMGHSTKADITAHYTHSTVAVLREAVGKLA